MLLTLIVIFDDFSSIVHVIEMHATMNSWSFLVTARDIINLTVYVNENIT